MPQTPPTDESKEALRTALESRAGVGTLTRMEGLDSIGESLEREGRMLDAEDRALHADAYGGAGSPPSGETGMGRGDPMKVMAARDVQVNHNYPAPPTPPATESPAKKPVGTAAKAALVASLLAGGGGLGAAAAVGIPWLMGMFDKPTVEQPTEPTDPNAYGLSL